MANQINPKQVAEELCLHLKEAIAAAGKGDEIAQAWLLQVFPANRVWLEMAWGQAQPTTEELREVSRARLEHLYRCLAQEQSRFNELTYQLQVERRDPLARELIARRQWWEVHQQQESDRVGAERYAAQQREAQERAQRAKEYEERTAQVIQQREAQNIRDTERKRQELIAGGFMP